MAARRAATFGDALALLSSLEGSVDDSSDSGDSGNESLPDRAAPTSPPPNLPATFQRRGNLLKPIDKRLRASGKRDKIADETSRRRQERRRDRQATINRTLKEQAGINLSELVVLAMAFQPTLPFFWSEKQTKGSSKFRNAVKRCQLFGKFKPEAAKDVPSSTLRKQTLDQLRAENKLWDSALRSGSFDQMKANTKKITLPDLALREELFGGTEALVDQPPEVAAADTQLLQPVFANKLSLKKAVRREQLLRKSIGSFKPVATEEEGSLAGHKKLPAIAADEQEEGKMESADAEDDEERKLFDLVMLKRVFGEYCRRRTRKYRKNSGASLLVDAKVHAELVDDFACDIGMGLGMLGKPFDKMRMQIYMQNLREVGFM